MSHARVPTTADAARNRDDETRRVERARHPWWATIALGAALAALGWIAVRLLDLDRESTTHGVRINTLERQFTSIDTKLDRLIERR